MRQRIETVRSTAHFRRSLRSTWTIRARSLRRGSSRAGRRGLGQLRLVAVPGVGQRLFRHDPERRLHLVKQGDHGVLVRGPLAEARGGDACVALARDGSKRPAADPVICPATRRMAEKLATPEGKARYARRKWLSEAPNGWIKEAMGFRRFSVRGLAKARGEWDLACLALNVVRMGRLAAA